MEYSLHELYHIMICKYIHTYVCISNTALTHSLSQNMSEDSISPFTCVRVKNTIELFLSDSLCSINMIRESALYECIVCIHVYSWNITQLYIFNAIYRILLRTCVHKYYTVGMYQ